MSVSRSLTGFGFSIIGGADQHLDAKRCLVRVKKVFPHSAAFEAGLLEGDVLLEVNDTPLDNLTNRVCTLLRYSTHHCLNI